MKNVTSTLYPVVCFITGTTPNGGGIWKYILHASPHGLLRRNLPVLTQVLHFLDFKISPQMLENRWRKPLREKYNGNFNLDYKAPIFTDSGGFTLMFDPDLDLSLFNIKPEFLAEGIMKLQIDLGADFVASLDYPIPPNLDETEVKRRMSATLNNAVRSAKYIITLPREKRPRLYVPIHGPTPAMLVTFVHDLIGQLKADGLDELLGGLALGSMVPLRRSNRSHEIVKFVRAARSAMPEEMPLHVYGVTGSLIPFLLAEGATSFDTSGYVQWARTLQYIIPTTRRTMSLRTLVDYPCSCPICLERNLEDDLALLEGRKEGQKSEVYAAIALHNLEQDFQLLASANAANKCGELPAFLQEIARKYSSTQILLAALNEPGLEIKPGKPFTSSPIHTHKPEDFDLRLHYHSFKTKKSICLILPCSQEKPYPASQSFKFIWRRLQSSLDKAVLDDIEIIFLSGLYGPVPIAYAEEDAVKTYDFLLHPQDQVGIERVGERLTDFLQAYKGIFRSTLAYVTLPAYRKAVELVTKSYPPLKVLPDSGRKGRLAFYRQENIQQLILHLQTGLEPLTDYPKSSSQFLDADIPAVLMV